MIFQGATNFLDKECASNDSTQANCTNSEAGKSVRIVFEELNLPKHRRILLGWIRQRTPCFSSAFPYFLLVRTRPTNKRPNHYPKIVGEGKEAESSCLSFLGAVLRNHSSDSAIQSVHVTEAWKGCRRTYTTVPANTPAKHLKRNICQIVLLSPKRDVAIETPNNEKTSTGFRPNRSAANPHDIMTSICVKEKRDSWMTYQPCSILVENHHVKCNRTYYPPRVISHVLHLYPPCLINHLINKRKNRKESNWLHNSCVAQ